MLKYVMKQIFYNGHPTIQWGLVELICEIIGKQGRQQSQQIADVRLELSYFHCSL